MATVVKNFRIKSGLVVEGTTGTINGQNILTETGGDSYILNLVGGATLVKSVDTNVFNVDNAGNLTINNNTFDSYGSASAAQDAAATDATNKANQALADAQTYANSLASNYDAAGSASTAESNANTYTDNKVLDYTKTVDLDSTIDGYGYLKSADLSGYATETYADNSATAAENNAKAYADELINDASNASNEVWSAYKTSTEIGLAQAAAELHADNAVASLVGSAPAVLDTIQELATALENNPDIIADLENVAAGKQNTLTAGSNIDITQDTISVTGLNTDDVAEGSSRLYFTNTRAQDAIGAGTGLTKDGQGTELAINRQVVDTWYDALGAAASAQTAAEGFATTAANNAQSAAEATAQAALDNVLDSTTPFTAVNVNDEAKQVAASSTSLGSVAVTAYEWAKADYRSAKFLVKIDNGTHNEISEILVTLDSSDNVAITEYAIVGTNGSRGTITADVSGSNVRLRVNPVNDSTIKVSGTLLK